MLRLRLGFIGEFVILDAVASVTCPFSFLGSILTRSRVTQAARVEGRVQYLRGVANAPRHWHHRWSRLRTPSERQKASACLWALKPHPPPTPSPVSIKHDVTRDPSREEFLATRSTVVT